MEILCDGKVNLCMHLDAVVCFVSIGDGFISKCAMRWPEIKLNKWEALRLR